MDAVEAILVGAGLRGRHVYAAYALERPERLRIVALAEPHPDRRTELARALGLDADAVFDDWRPLLAGAPRAPAAIIATGDIEHEAPALAALERGHHLLLEKPIAPTPEACVRVVEAAERAERILQIGHVLRHTAFYARVAEVVRSGRLGPLVHLDLREHVSSWHYAHSYVRGKFRNTAVAAPVLLAKSCHDLDLLRWIAGEEVVRVTSFGSRLHYGPGSAPDGAPARCTDACPARSDCPHDVERFYLAPEDAIARAWPWSDVSPDPSREARRRSLERGPYGQCVFRADNDQLDHQVVSVELAGGATATFALHGAATHERRTVRISGGAGELRGVLHDGTIEISRHGRLEVERIHCPGSELGHFGGDVGLIDHFVDAVGRDDRAAVREAGRTALAGHLLGFAAEEARRTGRVVDLTEFRRKLSTAGEDFLSVTRGEA